MNCRQSKSAWSSISTAGATGPSRPSQMTLLRRIPKRSSSACRSSPTRKRPSPIRCIIRGEVLKAPNSKLRHPENDQKSSAGSRCALWKLSFGIPLELGCGSWEFDCLELFACCRALIANN